MGLFDIFKKKRTPNYNFSDKDRELAVELRQINAERKKLLQEKEKIKAEMELEKARLDLEQMKADLYGDDEEEETDNSPENAFIMALMSRFLAPNVPQNDSFPGLNTAGLTPNPMSGSPLNSQSGKVVLTEKEIREMLKQIPRSTLKKIKKLDDETKRKLIISYMPALDPGSIDLGLNILKEY